LPDKTDLLLGLFAGFVIGFLVGIYLARAGVLGAPSTAAPKQYGVQYQYDKETGRLVQVLPVPVPG
jgi:hypothetical protein